MNPMRGAGAVLVTTLAVPVADTTLYFAYASFLDPERIASVAPGAVFRFTAHFPETRLVFVDTGEQEGLPTLRPEPGHTVWGGVFEIPEHQVAALSEAEAAEGRIGDWDTKAVDREGNKHSCLTFVTRVSPNGERRPDPSHLEAMIRGGRHWSLPAGWVMGLEDLRDEPPLS